VKRLAISALAALSALSAACAAPAASPDATDESALDGFVGDRNRSCAGGCAEGQVCDVQASACVAEPLPPSIIFPLAGTVTSGRPDVSWKLSPSSTEAAIEICADRACATSVARLSGTDHAAPTLPRGTYFVRAWGLRRAPDGHVIAGATATTPRTFRATGRGAVSRSPLGWFSDVDGDGLADLASGSVDAGFAPKRSTKDVGSLVTSGRGIALTVMPDVNGDGRTEVIGLVGSESNTEIAWRRLALPGESGANADGVLEKRLPTAANATLLLLGDVDRDGYADVGAARTIPSGIRLEILYGGAKDSFGTRRRTVDLRMPDEYGKPTQLASFSVVSDLDGDGYPEIALGGQAWDAPPAAPGVKPREGVFEEGASDGYRFYVFRGGPDPYRTTLPVIARAGEPYAGMTAAGDLDGDGFPDAVAIDTRPAALHAYTGASPWTDSIVGYRGGRVLVTYGGPAPALRTAELASPSFFRERPYMPDPSGLWTGLIPSYDAYREVPGIRTVTPARVREELFLPVSVGSAGDVDGDGFFDLAFTFLGPMRAPGAEAPWDAHSAPDPRIATPHAAQGALPAYTDYTFTGFLDVRHGSKDGPAKAAVQLVRSPTAKASPSLETWLSFPHVEARVNGIFAAERRENMHMNPPYFTPFAGVYAGPAGALALVAP
jgi:hypothetical protein